MPPSRRHPARRTVKASTVAAWWVEGASAALATARCHRSDDQAQHEPDHADEPKNLPPHGHSPTETQRSYAHVFEQFEDAEGVSMEALIETARVEGVSSEGPNGLAMVWRGCGRPQSGPPEQALYGVGGTGPNQ